jgi:hypothetical protein
MMNKHSSESGESSFWDIDDLDDCDGDSMPQVKRKE